MSTNRKILEPSKLVLPDEELLIPESSVVQICGNEAHAIGVDTKKDLETIVKPGQPIVTATGFDAGSGSKPTFFRVNDDGTGLETTDCDAMTIKPKDGIIDMRGSMAIAHPDERKHWDIGDEFFEIEGIFDFTNGRIRFLVNGQVRAERVGEQS